MGYYGNVSKLAVLIADVWGLYYKKNLNIEAYWTTYFDCVFKKIESMLLLLQSISYCKREFWCSKCPFDPCSLASFNFII